MISINPKYELLFDVHNIDEDFMKIAEGISIEGKHIHNILENGMYKQAITIYLQILKSMAVHFVADEHYCYFDGMYSPENVLHKIYDEIKKYCIGEEEQILLDIGHSEIMDSECYKEYSIPSYI